MVENVTMLPVATPSQSRAETKMFNATLTLINTKIPNVLNVTITETNAVTLKLVQMLELLATADITTRLVILIAHHVQVLMVSVVL
jgi:hypothetical protein